MSEDELVRDLAKAREFQANIDIEDAKNAVGWAVMVTDFEIDTTRGYWFKDPVEAMRKANQFESEHRREEFMSHICVLPLLAPEQ